MKQFKLGSVRKHPKHPWGTGSEVDQPVRRTERDKLAPSASHLRRMV
jgi:hypothetical protein